MATNTTFSEEHELIGINGKCNFVTTANGQLIKGVYSRKKGEIDRQTLGLFCRKVIQIAEQKASVKSSEYYLPLFKFDIRPTKDGYKAEAQLMESNYPFFKNINISFCTNKLNDTIVVNAFLDGVRVYYYSGSYMAFANNKKETNIKRLKPWILGLWRKDGYRPMYFKNRAYLMITGDHLPIEDLQIVANALKKAVDRYRRNIDFSVFKVLVTGSEEKTEVMAKIEQPGVDLCIRVICRQGTYLVTNYTDGMIVCREYGQKEFFQN